MTRRLLVVAVLLLMVAPTGSAKRRAVSPRPPSSCVLGTLVPATYSNVLAADEKYVYLVDDSSVLMRVPRLGGEVEPLAAPFEGLLALAIAVDATHVYISTLPFEAIFAPVPGSIIAVPKSGGVAEVLASGVETAFTLATDETHLYWTAAGILDFEEGEFRTGGKIERMKKDGSERATLAADLSAPLGLALTGDDVYFGESGFAAGDSSIGLHRVAKNGGTMSTIRPDMAIVSIGIADDGALIVLGGSEELQLGIFEVDPADPSTVHTILQDESLAFNMKVEGERVYVVAERETTQLLAIDLEAPGVARVVRPDLDGDSFVLVDCAAVVNTIDGDIVRTAR